MSDVNFNYDLHMQKVKEETLQKFNEYQKTILYMSCDLPIQILSLPKKTEKLLLNAYLTRLFDLIDLDFAKIKGLNDADIYLMTTRFNQFVSMCS